MRTRFVVNTRSGRAAAVYPEVRRFAEARGAEIVLTERARHGRELAAQAVAEGYERIVAVGGDGTMNEVATALVGTTATLGLVPCGSGDGLGRCLGLHGSLSRALRVLDTGASRLIDVGWADGHAFFTAAGIGFEAEIATRFNRLRRRGFFRYLTTSAKTFTAWQPQEYRIDENGATRTVTAFTLSVANADQYGNNARIAPGARVDDGLLNLTAVPTVTVFNAIPLATRLFAGNVDQATGVVSLCGPRFVVHRQAPGPLHTDGEVHDAGLTIGFEVQARALRVVCGEMAS